MRKQKKCNRINFRCTDEDWCFLQSLRAEHINISQFITTAFKTTDRYKKFYSITKGIA